MFIPHSNSHGSLVRTFALITIVCAFAILIGFVFLVFNPELIGEFFGKIVSGFKGV